jgi:hypothetical protein
MLHSLPCPARYGEYRVQDVSGKYRVENPGSRGGGIAGGENNWCQDGKVFETKCKIYYTISLHAK